MARKGTEPSDLLEGLRAALLRRRKAIRHKNALMDISEDIQDEDLRRMEVRSRFLSLSKSPLFAVTVWSDRWVWVDARQIGAKGWVWQWTAEGRVPPSIGPKPLSACIESSLSFTAHGQVERLETCWRPILARGPRPV